jgi:hypothetical protein
VNTFNFKDTIRVFSFKSIPGIDEGTKYGIATVVLHKMLIFKAGIDFLLWLVRPSSPENQFQDGIDSHEEAIL